RYLSALELDCGPKRVIEPSPQIPVDEQLLTEQGDEIGKSPGKGAAQLQVTHYQHRNQSCPDLRLDSVFAGADEALDAQSLLDGFEEQLDLPTILVDGRYGGGRQL